MTSITRGVLLVLVLGAAAVGAIGQGGATGAITGSVADSSGGVISGAKVEAVNSATNELVRSEATNASGLFTFTLLPAGTYKVQVNAAGFAETVLRDVGVRVTETTRLTVTLKAKTVEEKVEVTADIATVKTTDSTTGESLTGQTIRELPLATRNFQQLLALSSGASSSLNSASQLGRGDVRINVNGAREDNNNYQIEGVGANDPTNLGELANTPLPSPDAIQEFKVSTSLYDATQGRNGGGNINAVLKSGTDTVHFDVFEYFRNTVLNASDFFLNELGQPRPVIKQNIFGGSVGGPVGPKAKLGFFFLNYQGARQRSGDSPGTIISTSSLPYVPLADRNSNSLMASDCGLPSGSSVDPVTFALLGIKSGQFGSPAGGYLFPLPTSVPSTTPCGTLVPFVVSKAGKFTDDQFTANWDREFRSGKDRVSERFFWSDSETDEPFGGDSFTLQTGGVAQANNLNFPLKLPLRDRFGSLAETHIFRPALVNEFRFGVSVINDKLVSVQPLTTSGQPITDTMLGITRPTDNVTHDTYRFQLTSFAIGPYPTNPQPTLSDILSFIDTLSYVRGGHSLRFGGEFTRADVRRNTPVADNGFVFFFPSPGHSDFQNFLLGSTGLANAWSGLTNHDYRMASWSLFAQDDYRATKTLTLNLGLRNEFLGAPYDNLCHVANIDPTLANTTGQPFIYPRCINKFNLPGVTGTLGRAVLDNNYATVWAPRIGFAYDLFGRQTTSIRGGYGIYSVREDAGALDNLALAPPTVTGVFLGGGPGSLASVFNGAIPPVGVQTNNFIPQASIFQGFSTNGCTASGMPVIPTVDSTQTPCFSGNIFTFFGPVVPRHWIAPTMQQWNFSVQRALGKGWTLEVGYVGTKGTHLREVSDTNQATLASPQRPVVIPGTNCDGTTGAGAQCVITKNTFTNINARAPFRGLGPGGYEVFAPDANSHYNGLQVTVSHHFSAGLYVQSAYTYSKSIDDTSSGQVAFDSRTNDQTTGRATRGLSDFDRTHRWITSYGYTLPFFERAQGLTRSVLGGWEVNGVFTLQSGAPFSVIDSAGGTAYGLSSPGLVTPEFASGFSCATALSSGSVKKRLGGYLNRQAFQNVPADPNSPDGSTGYGNVPRNCFRGPRQLNWDFSIGKVFKFSERQSLKFTTEFFNLTNTASFATPGAPSSISGSAVDINSVCTNPACPAGPLPFGTITHTVGTPRLIQFSLRYSY
jgi:hypothetical protein